MNGDETEAGLLDSWVQSNLQNVCLSQKVTAKSLHCIVGSVGFCKVVNCPPVIACIGNI